MRAFSSHARPAAAFTLIELLMAVFAAAMILSVIYGVFSRAVRMRDGATERAHESRLRARAAAVIRNDLRNGIVSGGTLAATLEGSQASTQSHFPGHLKLTTTTGRNSTDELLGDVQEVEYYIAADTASSNHDAGVLMRTTDRNLLATLRAPTREEPLLTNVASMEVEFYDGQSWSDSWEMIDALSELPLAVRVRLQQAAGSKDQAAPAPLEILVPWRTQRSRTQ